MMVHARLALEVWRSRKPHSAGERAYLTYSACLIGLVVIVPAVRALWGAITTAWAQTLLMSPQAASTAVGAAGFVWAAALVAGRGRGPALLPPFPTHALALSGIPRSRAFWRPVVRAGSAVTAATTCAAVLVVGSLVQSAAISIAMATLFAGVGMLVGVLAVAAWLAGQSFPRAALPAAAMTAALAGICSGIPATWPFVPWGWVGLAFPTQPAASASAALVGLVAAGAAAISLVPMLMNRLDAAALVAQSVRWDRVLSHATGLELDAAARDYQPQPGFGRRLHAVRPLRWRSGTFLLRDAVGAIRTPGRLLAAIAALAAAGALLAFAVAPGTIAAASGCLAGVLAFAGLGPLTDGIRHAANVAAGAGLYGIADGAMLGYHSLFPTLVAVAVLVLAVIACAVVFAAPAALAVLHAAILSALATLARIASALKGPLPPGLLTPIPTPLGDLASAARVLWALDAMLLAAGAGIAVVMLSAVPLAVVAVAATLVGLTAARWLRR